MHGLAVPLCTGMTPASLKAAGTIVVSKDLPMRWEMGPAMIGARSLRTPTGMPSMPMAEVLFRPMINHLMDLLLSGSAELEGAITQGRRAVAVAAVPGGVAGVHLVADLGDLGQVVVVDVLFQRSVSSHYFPTFMQLRGETTPCRPACCVVCELPKGLGVVVPLLQVPEVGLQLVLTDHSGGPVPQAPVEGVISTLDRPVPVGDGPASGHAQVEGDFPPQSCCQVCPKCVPKCDT